jgi:hypothetical protein
MGPSGSGRAAQAVGSVRPEVQPEPVVNRAGRGSGDSSDLGDGEAGATRRPAWARRKNRRSVAPAKARARRCRSYWSKPSSSGVRALRIGPAYREERFFEKLLATYLDAMPIR